MEQQLAVRLHHPDFLDITDAMIVAVERDLELTDTWRNTRPTGPISEPTEVVAIKLSVAACEARKLARNNYNVPSRRIPPSHMILFSEQVARALLLAKLSAARHGEGQSVPPTGSP